MERSWHSLHIRLPVAFVEAISALCFDMGSCGTEVDDAGEQAQIKAYFPADCAVGTIEAELCSFAEMIGAGEIAIERVEVAEADWEAEWRRFFRPVWATPNVVIHPSWIPVDAGDALAIIIDPNMAFGTGGHESTQLCLQALESRVKAGMRCLDLGTGSGVLSIAAAQWGAEHVLALDIDPTAVDNARMNAELNGVSSSRVEVRVGSIGDCDSAAPCDLIVANIQSHVLLPILTDVRDCTVIGGAAIFSGLLVREREAFCAGVEDAGFVVEEVAGKNEWICVAARRAI